jgi:2-polyprenyl-6-methoxyphenol hydroxylase-like FAD-dependent oxidoreductase
MATGAFEYQTTAASRTCEALSSHPHVGEREDVGLDPEVDRVPGIAQAEVRFAIPYDEPPTAFRGRHPCELEAHDGARVRRMFVGDGYGSEHHPPTDEEGFMAFAASVAPPDVMAVLRDAEPLDDVVTYDFPANRRRRYDRLKILPKGLLVFGDALASFNPLYGQGMTVAALEAVALRDCLLHGERQLERRFLRAATHHVDHAWQMAIASDLALPEVEGHRSATVRVLNAYTDRLLRVARHDPVVATAFRSVVGMLRSPPHLMRPGIALRVLLG